MSVGGGGGGDPGGLGDVHVRTLLGHDFDFPGGMGKRFDFYERGDLKVFPRCVAVPGDPPDSPRTYIEGLDILTDRMQVYMNVDGTVNVFVDGYEFAAVLKVDTIDAPGHPGCTQDGPHPLRGVPHINVTVPHFPPGERPGERGVLVDGDREGARPEDYEVDG